MGTYVPNTEEEQLEMLKETGYKCFDDLFCDVPKEVRLKEELNLPQGISETEVSIKMEEIVEKNKIFKYIFRGAGAYNHYIPAVVKKVLSNETFQTAYTPYQSEISQGILQSIFEYQTMICELTGMDVSNASVYDGASAAAEAVAMCRNKKRKDIYISETINPEVMNTIKTYCYGSSAELFVVPERQGITDYEKLEKMLKDDAACFYMQQPNYYGIIEDGEKISNIVHGKGANFIMACNPISLGILKTPGECGADISVGEGQPLGIPLYFGGPYLGFMASTSKMMRKLPGRIVGETIDVDGKRAFVLTLQAREQHIKRERASSNICSNEALCAMAASVYMAAMGSEGMREMAIQCTSKAHYLQKELENIGFKLKYPQEFFHEFVTISDKKVDGILKELEKEGILGGLPIGEKEILWCTTELNTKDHMDKLVHIIKEMQCK